MMVLWYIVYVDIGMVFYICVCDVLLIDSNIVGGCG